ncbi:FMN phosphatase YigB, HAD superfamily [Enhydrobacter aerosaccus]|uniref:FMN phosphatase YigB, HAD superfamily n=1 Tax=Enhydrobacter aerosaccus TaxID=225324 RepID=A0A1T4KCT4_9HYPH|nr:HAD hydrolase-like protein [Enhydrobacter aerosaccus]SJZ40143.1 FMN phosphatase YigB, HAD superfamily [Enhydrobacter aerosaccus]
MTYRAVLFDIGGAIDLEFAWEMAVDGAIASACSLEGIRVDQPMVEAASEQAVLSFAADTYGAMIGILCGGEPRTIGRVTQRFEAMTRGLDVFQLRPGIEQLLHRLVGHGVVLSAADYPRDRLERAGIAPLFADDAHIPAVETIFVGDRLDQDVAPAKAQGMTTIQFRSGRWRRQKPRSAAETPDVTVTDVRELEEAIFALLADSR